MPNPIAFEDEMAGEKIKRHKHQALVKSQHTLLKQD